MKAVLHDAYMKYKARKSLVKLTTLLIIRGFGIYISYMFHKNINVSTRGMYTNPTPTCLDTFSVYGVNTGIVQY